MYYLKKFSLKSLNLIRRPLRMPFPNPNNSNQYNHVKIDLYYAKNIYREIRKYTVISPRDK
jgi:hypothetical protein